MSCGLSRFAAGVLASALLPILGVTQTVVEPQSAAPGESVQSSAKVAVTARTNEDREKLRIGPGDLIDVSVYGVSDFHQEARVNESGDVSLPLVGAVRVGGSTVQGAQDTIAKSLMDGRYFRDPHVTVVIKDFASQGVSVLGEVTRPGIYPMVGTKRLYDLISQAGGFTPKAGKLVTITHRDDPGNPVNVIMTQDPAKSLETNVEVYPGDTIAVSKAGIVYVVGDVQRPGGFVMENNEHMTVLQAVALAQGTNRTASLGSARILRRTPSGPSEVKIPLKEIMAAKASDMDLMPEDILFIPGSAAKRAFTRGVESVFQVATSMAIYAH